ncbi:MAG TPA: hypothetical protein VKA94_05130 [Hyphomicrobiales bacterium]|nr:hypothetical protein [Hyphomicrobiales bacterium]
MPLPATSADRPDFAGSALFVFIQTESGAEKASGQKNASAELRIFAGIHSGSHNSNQAVHRLAAQ